MTLTAIGPREASIFACLTDAFILPVGASTVGEAMLPPVCDTVATGTFDTWLSRSPRVNRIALRVLLHVAELAPLLTGGGRRLRRLDPERRRRWLWRVEHVPVRALRDVVRGVKTLSMLCYYGDPRVMALLGYDAEANVRRGRELRRAEGRP